MAITAAEYSAVYSINSNQQTALEATHGEGHLAHVAINPESSPFIAGILKEVKDLQTEIDYLRTEISANKDKASMALGTTSTTALAGDTNIVTIGSSTTIAFGNMITRIDKNTGKITGYDISMTATKGGVSKSVKLTLT